MGKFRIRAYLFACPWAPFSPAVATRAFQRPRELCGTRAAFERSPWAFEAWGAPRLESDALARLAAGPPEGCPRTWGRRIARIASASTMRSYVGSDFPSVPMHRWATRC
eukprot:8632574-Pyramimonas_sp.AAC.1